MNLLDWLIPWEFSLTLVLVFLTSVLLFVRGGRLHRVSRARQVLFWSGTVLLYIALHTRLDYYAERLFFIHRIQHVVLHHLGPLLLMAAYPGSVLWAGLPHAVRRQWRGFRECLLGHHIIRLLTHPFLVPIGFVVLGLVWLLPSIQFYSMIDARLYRLMNWTAVVSGVMYWNLILDRRPSPPAALSPGARVLSPIFTMAPQMMGGAYIALTEHDLYPFFEVCGRAIQIPALRDQSIGGLTLWIPAAFVEAMGMLIALATWMRLSDKRGI